MFFFKIFFKKSKNVKKVIISQENDFRTGFRSIESQKNYYLVHKLGLSRFQLHRASLKRAF